MQPQLGLEDLPPRLFVCTPSRLLAWADCPRRYRMTYLDRPTPPRGGPWAHNSLGSAVHLALARWWDLPLAGRRPSAAAGLVSGAWRDDGFRDADQSGWWRERAVAMVRAYLGRLDPDCEPVGVERTVGLRTRVLAASGRVDRVDRRGDELVVVDYKTGRRPLNRDDARGSLALALYALACRRTFRRECWTVELHHLPTGEVVEHRHDGPSLERHLGRAESLGREAAAATAALAEGEPDGDLFPPRPGPLCAWCDLAQHCPEGLAAAPRRLPWSGLDDGEPLSP